MIEVIKFYVGSIVQFINSLRSIQIDNQFSLLSFLIGFMVIQAVVGFVLGFFNVERRTFNKGIYKGYFKRRQALINSMSDNQVNKTHTTKYLQNRRK